jgi:hypothetical protein
MYFATTKKNQKRWLQTNVAVAEVHQSCFSSWMVWEACKALGRGWWPRETGTAAVSGWGQGRHSL